MATMRSPFTGWVANKMAEEGEFAGPGQPIAQLIDYSTIKLTVTVPDYFNARIKPKNLSLCKVDRGGMLSRSKCKKTLPAVFEVNKEQTAIEVFPEQPIPTGGTYAVVMKIFNPNKGGMFQFNALAQAPGDVPVAGYLGSWLIDIEQ